MCTVCKCGEIELTTECPGVVISEIRRELISQGKLDFKDGHWVILGRPAVGNENYLT